MGEFLSKLARTITAIVALLAVGLTPTIASAADNNPVPVEQRQIAWLQPKLPLMDARIGSFGKGRTISGFVFSGGVDAGWPSTSVTTYGASNPNGSLLCDASLSCIKPGYEKFSAKGFFPDCETAKFAPCIESLEYKTASSDFQKAEFVRFADGAVSSTQLENYKKNNPNVLAIQTSDGWKGNQYPGLPASATGPAIYRFPGVSNGSSSDTYTLNAGFGLDGGVSNGTFVPDLSDFSVAVHPTKIDNGQSGGFLTAQIPAVGGRGNVTVSTITNNYLAFDPADVAFLDKSAIGWATQFPAGLTLRLTLRLPQNVGGWFQGRADSPSIDVQKISSTENRVAITANPTSVPMSAVDWYTFDEANAGLPLVGPPADDAAKALDAAGNGGASWRSWQPLDGLQPLTALNKLLGDKAKGFGSVWGFKKLRTNQQCMNDNTSLQGILTTNAMTYQADLPSYSGGFLNYSVAGLHYDSNGQVFNGTYDFIMKDSVARCLYGFKGAGPISGTVTVTSSGGAENVAYTNVTDDGQWLKLTAHGFTFSNPTISAKLSQAGSTPDAPATDVGSSSGASGSAAKSITCTKGKLTKKLTSATAKCPTGWKKK